MKKFFSASIIGLCFLVSCKSDDADFISIDVDEPENVITTPCDFDLSNLSANESIQINCLLDLQGAVVTLPADVDITFGGGDIINGTLEFNGGTIDGRLLSSKLNIEGDVQLSDPAFKLYAVRWGITEGATNSETALSNNQILEETMFLVHSLGATKFVIDKLDAYFEVTKVTSTTTNANWYPSLEAVNIPSDFHLSMSENTKLRIYPGGEHNLRGGGILAVRDAENITVSGGNLYGDRDVRRFSSEDNGTEGSHLFIIQSGRNITIDGVNFENGSAGTFAIQSFGFSFNSDTYNPTDGVTIKNCVLKNSRRMAIALTDGRDILIEGNTFINAGQPSANTDGGEVGYAINIEPARTRDEAGELKEYQKVFDVLIKGNTETGSRGGFATLTIGQDITLSDNDIGTRVVYSLVSGVRLTGNRFQASGDAVDSWAIFCAGSGETVFDNEVSENTIEGYKLGVVVGSVDSYIHDNIIKKCGAGIQISKAIGARINKNIIDVINNGIQATNTNMDDVEIRDNDVTTEGNFNLYFTNMNSGSEFEHQQVLIDANTFYSTKAIIFSNSTGMTFSNNMVAGGVSIGNVSKSTFSNNIIRPHESSGIRLHDEHSEVYLTDNTIYEPTGAERYQCIQNDSSTPGSITMAGNTCN